MQPPTETLIKGKETDNDGKPKKDKKEKALPKPDFYTVKYSDEDKNQVRDVTIKIYNLVALLKNLGFMRMEVDNNYFTIKLENNIAKEVNQAQVIDAFEDYIKNDCPKKVSEKYPIEKEVLLDKIYKGISTYFSDNILNRLRPERKVDFVTDTKNESFFFYRNCVVRVSKVGIDTLSYAELGDKKIWANQILDRDFEKVDEDKFLSSNFAKFLLNVSGDNERFNQLLRIIGYNLHRYFEGKLKATILTDSSLSEDPDGRTGKTLLCKGLGHMLNVNKEAKTYVELNGKNFNFTDKHRYQELGLDSKLVHINDAPRDLKFELLFNDITEGIKVEKKNQAPFRAEAKMIISANKTIRIKGGSAEDRCLEFQLANYYSSELSPLDEFNEWFFTEWGESAWCAYDNLMLFCTQQYLQYGLIKPTQINLDKRKLLDETKAEFVSFMDDLLKGVKQPQWYEKTELYNSFVEQYPDFENLRQRTFTSWIKLYCEYVPGIAPISDDDEKRTNSKDKIRIPITEG